MEVKLTLVAPLFSLYFTDGTDECVLSSFFGTDATRNIIPVTEVFKYVLWKVPRADHDNKIEDIVVDRITHAKTWLTHFSTSRQAKIVLVDTSARCGFSRLKCIGAACQHVLVR